MLPKIITDIQIGRFKVSIARLSVRALDSLNSLNLPVIGEDIKGKVLVLKTRLFTFVYIIRGWKTNVGVRTN